MSIQKEIMNTRITGSSACSFKQYFPAFYKDRQKRYYNYETRLFNEQIAQYAGDYVEAQIQGLNPEYPFEYTTVHVRFSDIVRSSSAISYEFDNYKVIDIAERQYDYIRLGAKVKAMGNTWLCINPSNMGNELGKAIIQRCDAVWHYLDYYGNVCTEPMCFDRRLMKANDGDAQRATMITKGYFDAKVQYNDATKNLYTNTRIILGTSAYRITGYSDFIQEFTDDESSINLLQFDVRYEEPNSVIDDMENKVAGGLTFAWDITINSTPAMKVGETTSATASSTRTAEEYTSVVESTEEYPISYKWESSDENVLEIDQNGNITAVGEGTANIICILEQNQNKTAEFGITVAGDATEPHVAFGSTVPEKLRMFESIELTANYFENGEAVPDVDINFSYSEADQNAYTASVEGNVLTLKCWGGSVKPLRVVAEYNGYSEEFLVHLEGI